MSLAVALRVAFRTSTVARATQASAQPATGRRPNPRVTSRCGPRSRPRGGPTLSISFSSLLRPRGIHRDAVASARRDAAPRPAPRPPPPRPQAPRRPVAARAGAPEAPAESIDAVDLRVGTIVEVGPHPEADNLFVERIECGDVDDAGAAAGPRTVVSGLVGHCSADDLMGRSVVVVANLKARNLRGVKSHGMVLCASEGGEGGDRRVAPVAPPADARPGDRCRFVGGDALPGSPEADEDGVVAQCAAWPENRLQKKKVWEGVQPGLRTDAAGACQWEGRAMVAGPSGGAVTAPGFAGAGLS